jgi:sigma-B regulation protein RsbU (phosphoserine phosphatase)
MQGEKINQDMDRLDRILIVEDESIVRRVLSKALKHVGGYEIYEAENGREGLEKACEILPDLVLLDWTLPELEGPDVLKAIRENSVTRNIPVIMLTGRGTLEDRIVGLHTGANEYIVKPFDVRELIIHVQKLLEQAHKVKYLNPLIGVMGGDFTAEGIEHLGRDLEMAVDIQQKLIPSQCPDVNGFEISARLQPARLVGGDFYDFIQLDSSHMVIFIGDVVGKGIPAALMMVTIRAIIRYIAKEEQSPAKVLEKLNTFLCENLGENRFVTLFYGVIDIPGRKMTFADGGHVKPVVLSRERPESVYLKCRGVTLGIYNNARFEEKTVEFSHGDIVVLYTDGIVEAHDSGQNEFGVPGLERIIREHADLKAGDILEGVFNAVYSHNPGTLQDDMTCIVLKYL